MPRALCALAMTDCTGCDAASRWGERTERCQWQRKRGERVAAVKISSVRRKAAQKFWAPQQDHRPLRKRNKRGNGRATARVAPTESVCNWAAWRMGVALHCMI